MKKSNVLWYGLLVLVMAACQAPDAVNQEGAGYTYFPLEAGRFTEYEVNEIRYTVTSPTPKSTTYYLKEVCGQPYSGLTGVEQFPIERYKKGTLEANWVLDSVWTAYRLPDRAVRIENNTAFVKLAFPLVEEGTWNGNLLNTQPEEAYKVHFEVPFPAQSDFPGSLTVVQRQDSSIVSLYKRHEVYAPGVGLVYKEDTAWEYCQEPACIGSGKIDTGTRRIIKITKHGVE
ncbi:hypothetical protein [Salmonirosea aquatica]|uniref:Lipoprotein n=1 Tax=Salmonirosea aquatica TaxID=2654236 RepID=A0A7C9FZL1_9BACT|nr:hypothetical protein [Cytophagaceae bacterium SJW1-29]